MDVQIGEQTFFVHPPSPSPRIHHLNVSPVLAPDDDKVRQSIRQADDDKRGERVRFRQQEMISGNHNLLGVQAKLDGDLLDHIN